MRARAVQLLEIMIDNLGPMLTKEDVADTLYTFHEAPGLNAVEQLVTRLRRKLDGTPLVIKTARDLGCLPYVADDEQGTALAQAAAALVDGGGVRAAAVVDVGAAVELFARRRQPRLRPVSGRRRAGGAGTGVLQF
uniref:helix-turn-helix domain-containing protein n=1 Tax=Salipiger aestuarii TaxID=568098 RepID=UPI001CC2FAE6|nr:helix-turn-helix domain-containing protein [Salipiger aestuarii]